MFQYMRTYSSNYVFKQQWFIGMHISVLNIEIQIKCDKYDKFIVCSKISGIRYFQILIFENN